MGEVIKMFGDSGESGPFGTSYNTQGLGQVSAPEPDYGPPQQPPNAVQAGAPAPPVTVNQDIESGVALALQYARTATNRLVNIPPPGGIVADTRRTLLEAYSTIEDNARQIVDAARTSGAGIDLGRETTKLQEDVQGYVQAVEEALAPYLGAGGQPAAPVGNSINWPLWGALAAGAGLVGFATYKAQQQRGK